MEHISSRQNALVKRLRELVRPRGPEDDVLLEGPHMLEEALRSHVAVSVACFASTAADGALKGLAERSAAAGARVITVPPSLLASISPVRQSTGVVAIARLEPRPLRDTLTPAPALVLVLDGVQDPGNVGAVIRAAEGCGATGVLTSRGTADPYGWKALRGAMGSTFRLPVATQLDVREAVTCLRRERIRVFATVPRGGTPLGRASFAGASAILLGGEGAGLSADLLANADEQITIEMRPPVESLNVAVSAALILYEASRQRAHVAVR